MKAKLCLLIATFLCLTSTSTVIFADINGMPDTVGLAGLPQPSSYSPPAQVLSVPLFNVIINNQLAEQVKVGIYPQNYLPESWNGKCNDTVESMQRNKTICSITVAGISYGEIPAQIVRSHDNKNNQAEVMINEYYLNDYNPNWYLLPFDGDIMIGSANADNHTPFVSIHYALKAHPGTLSSWERNYIQWEPLTFKVTASNPKIKVTVENNYPNGYSWCYLYQDRDIHPSKIACNASFVITVSGALGDGSGSGSSSSNTQNPVDSF